MPVQVRCNPENGLCLMQKTSQKSVGTCLIEGLLHRRAALHNREAMVAQVLNDVPA